MQPRCVLPVSLLIPLIRRESPVLFPRIRPGLLLPSPRMESGHESFTVPWYSTLLRYGAGAAPSADE